jgi:plastocyanin
MKAVFRGPMSKARPLVVLGLSGTLCLALAGSVSAGADRTVRMTGGEHFVPNAMIQATLRFAPGPLSVASGDTVTWSNETEEPHTVTVVEGSDVPTTIDEVFSCGAPGTPCFDAIVAHTATDPPTLVVGGGADGAAGLDGAGDSLLVFPGAQLSAKVTAASGTTLHYICAIHPWMIGSISVR